MAGEHRNPFDFQNPIFESWEIFYRENEYEILKENISSASFDSRSNIMVTGRPKIGKTSFVNGAKTIWFERNLIPIFLTIESLGEKPSAGIVTQIFDSVIETLVDYEYLDKGSPQYQSWKSQTVFGNVNPEQTEIFLESGLKISAQKMNPEISQEFDSNSLKRDWKILENFAKKGDSKFSGFVIVIDEITNLANVDLKTQNLVARVLNSRSGGVVVTIVEKSSVESLSSLLGSLSPTPVNIQLGPFSNVTNEFMYYGELLSWYRDEFFPNLDSDVLGSSLGTFYAPFVFGQPWRFKLISHFLFEDFRKSGQFILNPSSVSKLIELIGKTNEGIERSLSQKEKSLSLYKGKIEDWLNRNPDKIATLDELITSARWNYLPALENTAEISVGNRNYGKSLKEMEVLLTFPLGIDTEAFKQKLSKRIEIARELWDLGIIDLADSEMKVIDRESKETTLHIDMDSRPVVDFDPVLWLLVRMRYLEKINGPVEKSLMSKGSLKLPESAFQERSTYLSSIVRTTARKITFDIANKFGNSKNPRIWRTTHSDILPKNIFDEATLDRKSLKQSSNDNDLEEFFKVWSLQDLSVKNGFFFYEYTKETYSLWLWTISLRVWPEEINYSFMLKHGPDINPESVREFYQSKLKPAYVDAFSKLGIEATDFDFELVPEPFAKDLAFVASRDANITRLEDLLDDTSNYEEILTKITSTADLELEFHKSLKGNETYDNQMRERFVGYGMWSSGLKELTKAQEYLKIASTTSWPSVYYLQHSRAINYASCQKWDDAVRYLDGAMEYASRNREHRDWSMPTFSIFQKSWSLQTPRLSFDLNTDILMKLEWICIVLCRELSLTSKSTFYGEVISETLRSQLERDLDTDFETFLKNARKEFEIWGQETLASCYYLLGDFAEASEILKEMVSATEHLGKLGIEMARIDFEESKSRALEEGVTLE